MYARIFRLRVLARNIMGAKRSSDSAMPQLVFFWVNDSVAAVNIESSMFGMSMFGMSEVARDESAALAPEEAEGIVLGSCEDAFNAGPLSLSGEGGGVGYASCFEVKNDS